MQDAWLQTYSGRQFCPLAPNPANICIEDIAHSLANICRYSGHSIVFYSVAEHSIHISHHVPYEHALAALLHDASEAYITDIPSPIKPYLSGYADIERRLEECIALKFGLAYPWDKSIKEADARILADERKQIMNPTAHSNEEWGAVLPPLGVVLPCWDPPTAERMFLERFWTLVRNGHA